MQNTQTLTQNPFGDGYGLQIQGQQPLNPVIPTGPTTGHSTQKEATINVHRSNYRGVSYDRKKRKWRVQIKVASLGKSGVSVGYFDTEDQAARAYDRAAIGLLGKDNCLQNLNFPIKDYNLDEVPELQGKKREEVKALLKSERVKWWKERGFSRKRMNGRRRTSKYWGVGSSNRKNQWQARILYQGKVTHLGYYKTEEEAARVYDRVSLSIHGPQAQTNFKATDYTQDDISQFQNLGREDLQKALGVKPMDKSSRFRGVSKKKGKWEAKVMLNSKWVYRELFDTEEAAARAYDDAVWRLKPLEAPSYVNFPDQVPENVKERLQSMPRQESLTMAPPGDLLEEDCDESMSEAESLHTQSMEGGDPPPAQRLKKCASDVMQFGQREGEVHPLGGMYDDKLALQHHMLSSAADMNMVMDQHGAVWGLKWEQLYEQERQQLEGMGGNIFGDSSLGHGGMLGVQSAQDQELLLQQMQHTQALNNNSALLTSPNLDMNLKNHQLLQERRLAEKLTQQQRVNLFRISNTPTTDMSTHDTNPESRQSSLTVVTRHQYPSITLNNGLNVNPGFAAPYSSLSGLHADSAYGSLRMSDSGSFTAGVAPMLRQRSLLRQQSLERERLAALQGVPHGIDKLSILPEASVIGHSSQYGRVSHESLVNAERQAELERIDRLVNSYAQMEVPELSLNSQNALSYRELQALRSPSQHQLQQLNQLEMQKGYGKLEARRASQLHLQGMDGVGMGLDGGLGPGPSGYGLHGQQLLEAQHEELLREQQLQKNSIINSRLQQQKAAQAAQISAFQGQQQLQLQQQHQLGMHGGLATGLQRQNTWETLRDLNTTLNHCEHDYGVGRAGAGVAQTLDEQLMASVGASQAGIGGYGQQPHQF